MSQKSGYLLVMGTASDPVGMDAYHAQLPPIYKAHGGYRLAMGAQSEGATFLSGGLQKLAVMLARFPSPESVSAFWWSEAYRQAYRARKNAGRFAAVALPGLDEDTGVIAGGRGYLIALATPESPGRWRRFADALGKALENRGATILIDDGPEAIERLESLLPGSHVLAAMLPSHEEAVSAWTELETELSDLLAEAQPVDIIALNGLADDHPGRLIS